LAGGKLTRRAFLRLALAFGAGIAFRFGLEPAHVRAESAFSFPLAFPASFGCGETSPNGGAANRVYLPLIFRGR